MDGTDIDFYSGSAKSIQAAVGGGGQCFVSSLLLKLLSLWDVNWHSPRVLIYLTEDFHFFFLISISN